ncbi:MAG: S8 family serine peptidase, partial [Hymenobacteraceae bacterium]|nr:S8 family serine peptidase [Hymenobacteraceae bacterium]
MHSVRLFLLAGLLATGLTTTLARAQAPTPPPVPVAGAADTYRPGVVVFRVAAAHAAQCSPTAVGVPQIQRVLTALGVLGLERVFPHVAPPSAARRAVEPRCVDLTTIYRAHYAAPVAVAKAAAALRATGAVQYAEPDFYGLPSYTPNDPEVGRQYALDQIHALDAWNTQRGDSSVLIGIVDTGVQYTHVDLAANIQRNFADPINGLDDDGDGYVDNYHGWDFVGAFFNQPAGDNEPGGRPVYHGTHVAGLASAVADNGIGVAGVGFRCRLLPIKCAGDNNGGFIINGYAGLVYAADHGCDIINCSWGILGFPDLGQDAINYATFNRGALVVTAAGNNGVADPFSPAGFENVLTVGAVGPGDVRVGFSNYGVNTEVFAPGLQVYSTLPTNAYGNNSGTSMASPVTAGAAGLVKAQFPTYSGEQIGQQLRMTCDNIDAVNAPALAGLLGRGRINVLRAITENPSAVRFLRKRYLTGVGGAPTPLFAGANVVLTGDVRSILKPTTGLTVTLSCASPLITIAQPTLTLGTLATGQSVVGEFALAISPAAPANTLVRFNIKYQDQAGYQDNEKFEVLLNPSFRDLTANRLHTSITSNGRIGFNDNLALQGLGLVYKTHDNLLWEMGLMVGTDSAHVSNSVIHIASYPQINDDHFQPLNGPVRPTPLPRADQDLTGWLDDRGAGAAALPVQVRYRAQQWAAAPNDRHILVSYTLRNPGARALTNLYAGLYADWDIGAGITNKATWDASRQLGYAYSNEPDSAYAGIRLLAPVGRATFRALDF